MRKAFYFVLLTILAALSLCAADSSGQRAGAPKTPNPMPPTDNLFGVTFGAGLHVAVGAQGTVAVSQDGVNWVEAVYAGTDNDLRGVAYGNGVYVAVGDNGWTVTSPDGTNWTSISSGATVDNLNGITFANDKFVAVGRDGTLITSPDGTNWTESSYASTVTDTNDSIEAITCAQGIFVAVGDDDATTFSSSDGQTWSQGGGGFNDDYATSVTCGNGLFVATAGSQIYASADGSTWAQRANTAQQLNGVSYGGGLFVAIGNSGVMFSSPDGTIWTAAPALTDQNLYGINFDGKAFQMVGGGGATLSATPAALSATTQVTFSQELYYTNSVDTNDSLQGVVFGGGQFVIVGDDDDTSFTSQTGTRWSQGGAGLNDDYFAGVAYGNGLYVAMSSGGNLFASSNGVSWTKVAGINASLTALAYGNGVFVAVGNGGVVETSSNAKQWTSRSASVTVNITGILFDGTQFVAVDNIGEILVSPNGASWTVTQTAPGAIPAPGQALSAITYGNGRYVAVGPNGYILTSTNASSSSAWVQPATYVGTANGLNSVAWGGNEFIGVGDNGWVVTSPDGLNWSSRSSPTISALNAIVFAAGEFVAVGDNGVILTTLTAPSGPVIGSQPVSQTTSIGKTVVLQVSAAGEGTEAFQWQFDSMNLQNGAAISGATSATLTLTGVTLGSAGSYDVIVTDSTGSVTSAVATVTVGGPPAISRQPVSVTEPAGAVASFTVAAGTTPAPSYAWYFNGAPLANGGAVQGAASSSLLISPVTAGNAGSYDVVVSDSFGSVTSSVASLTLGTETAKPIAGISFPTANNVRTNGATMQGFASDKYGVQAVNYRITNVNNGVTMVASGQATLNTVPGATNSTWYITTPPRPGSNVLAVQSVNYANLVSALTNRSFFYRVPATMGITVSPSGGGSVTGASSVAFDAAPTNGGELYIGEGYTVTANPAQGWAFDNWSANGSILTTNPVYNFIMETNLVLQANFSSNLLAMMGGTYDGLFSVSSDAGPAAATAGRIGNFAVKTNGAYTGSMYFGGKTYALSGKFNTSGQAVFSVARTALAGGALEVTLDWGSSNGIAQITGTVRGANTVTILGTNSAGWMSDIYMPVALGAGAANSGEYTALIPQNASVAGSPPGFGFVTITNHSGTLTISGQLADGTAFTESTVVGKDNQFPLFASLYNGGGLLFGRLSLAAAGASQAPNGEVWWIKPAARTGLYQAGFDVVTMVEGSPWTRPRTTGVVVPSSSTLAFSGGGLSSNIVMTVSANSTGAIQRLTGPNDFISGSYNLNTGMLSISFYNTSHVRVNAYGALLQEPGTGAGYFLGTASGGAFTIGFPMIR